MLFAALHTDQQSPSCVLHKAALIVDGMMLED